jgi:hypothetical protein
VFAQIEQLASDHWKKTRMLTFESILEGFHNLSERLSVICTALAGDDLKQVKR